MRATAAKMHAALVPDGGSQFSSGAERSRKGLSAVTCVLRRVVAAAVTPRALSDWYAAAPISESPPMSSHISAPDHQARAAMLAFTAATSVATLSFNAPRTLAAI